MRHRPRRGNATFQTLLFGGVTGAALLCLAGLGGCAGGPGSGVQIDWVNVVPARRALCQPAHLL